MELLSLSGNLAGAQLDSAGPGTSQGRPPLSTLSHSTPLANSARRQVIYDYDVHSSAINQEHNSPPLRLAPLTEAQEQANHVIHRISVPVSWEPYSGKTPFDDYLTSFTQNCDLLEIPPEKKLGFLLSLLRNDAKEVASRLKTQTLAAQKAFDFAFLSDELKLIFPKAAEPLRDTNAWWKLEILPTEKMINFLTRIQTQSYTLLGQRATPENILEKFVSSARVKFPSLATEFTCRPPKSIAEALAVVEAIESHSKENSVTLAPLRSDVRNVNSHSIADNQHFGFGQANLQSMVSAMVNQALSRDSSAASVASGVARGRGAPAQTNNLQPPGDRPLSRANTGSRNKCFTCNQDWSEAKFYNRDIHFGRFCPKAFCKPCNTRGHREGACEDVKVGNIPKPRLDLIPDYRPPNGPRTPPPPPPPPATLN